MTAREFKSRLAAGDKLAVVMHALWKFPRTHTPNLSRQNRKTLLIYAEYAAHILAALASAGVKK